jgi:hypothetical protein
VRLFQIRRGCSSARSEKPETAKASQNSERYTWTWRANFSHMRSTVTTRKSHNGLKLSALGVFDGRDWLPPATWAVLAGFYPVRSAYTYLKRLHRLRLLDRTLDRRGMLRYRINSRGVARLAWLKERREK